MQEKLLTYRYATRIVVCVRSYISASLEVRGLNQSIANKIGVWLFERGHTKKSLAAELGMSVTTLNSRLRGTTQWMWPEVVQLAGMFGCSTQDLI